MSEANCVWEILVPTAFNSGEIISIQYHKNWDKKVRTISVGLTIMHPVRGQWQAGEELFEEQMIPVRVVCTQEQIETIAELTARWYEQKAILFYLVSDKVFIREYPR